MFSPSNQQYLHEIQSAQNVFSRNVTRITIRAMCNKRDDLDKQILQCRNELSKICPSVLVHSIRAKIQELNSKLFQIVLNRQNGQNQRGRYTKQ